MDFNKLLDQMKREWELTETEAAKVLGIPRSSIYDYKTGKINKKVAIKVAQFFLKMPLFDQAAEINKALSLEHSKSNGSG